MTDTIPQFGSRPDTAYKDRRSAYGVVLNEQGKLLTLQVKNTYHLVGGGIEAGEDAKQALVREAVEEAGCIISNLVYIGRANQFFEKTELGPLNKLGVFYQAALISIDITKSEERDHRVCWLHPEVFLTSLAGDFQKWAVEQVVS